jgi:hypothetical protein
VVQLDEDGDSVVIVDIIVADNRLCDCELNIDGTKSREGKEYDYSKIVLYTEEVITLR